MSLAPSFRRAAFAPRLARSARAIRTVHTESLPPSASETILNDQRLRRPSSPHFTIYQPQLTWLGSIANRVTGAGLSTLLYGFALAYLVAPETCGSANVLALVASAPAWAKVGGKAVLAAPFAFHGWNGVRHLAWDLGKFANVKGVYSTGYAVLGATAVSTAYLMWM